MKFLYLIILFCSLQSCSFLMQKGFGLKKGKELSKDEIAKQGSKYNIPVNDSYELDSSYIEYLFSLDTTTYKKEQKNHFQPLQALYYDQSGQLKSFHINCYAGGFPNLKWNRFGAFDEFIPKQQAPIDSVLSLQNHLNYVVPLGNQTTFESNEYDFVILVHWNRFMSRQSKRLIKIVQQNALKNERYRIKIIYLNNDNIFVNTDQ